MTQNKKSDKNPAKKAAAKKQPAKKAVAKKAADKKAPAKKAAAKKAAPKRTTTPANVTTSNGAGVTFTYTAPVAREHVEVVVESIEATPVKQSWFKRIMGSRKK